MTTQTEGLLEFILEHGHYHFLHDKVGEVHWDDDSRRKECQKRWLHEENVILKLLDGQLSVVGHDGSIHLYFYGFSNSRWPEVLDKCIEIGMEVRFEKASDFASSSVRQAFLQFNIVKSNEFEYVLRKQNMPINAWVYYQIQLLESKNIKAQHLVVPVWMDEMIQKYFGYEFTTNLTKEQWVADAESKNELCRVNPLYYQPLERLFGLPVVSVWTGDFQVVPEDKYKMASGS